MRIDLPLRRVTAYEDRAAFERSGAVTLPGGPLELEIEGVSPLISDAHLSGALLDAPAGAAVDDVRVERRWVAVGGESAERMLALERTLEAAADARFVTEQGLTRSAERRAAAERELARFIEAGARAAWSGLDVPAFSAGERNLALALQTSDAAVDAARQALQGRHGARAAFAGPPRPGTGHTAGAGDDAACPHLRPGGPGAAPHSGVVPLRPLAPHPRGAPAAGGGRAGARRVDHLRHALAAHGRGLARGRGHAQHGAPGRRRRPCPR